MAGEVRRSPLAEPGGRGAALFAAGCSYMVAVAVDVFGPVSGTRGSSLWTQPRSLGRKSNRVASPQSPRAPARTSLRITPARRRRPVAF